MTGRPIIFSAPMVRALLDGRKTQTRRLLKPQPDMAKINQPAHPEPRGGRNWVFMARDDFPGYSYATADFRLPYAVGDRLWVREAWNTFCISQDGDDSWPTEKIPRADPRLDDGRVTVVTEYAAASDDKGPWRPSIHMPRWASRLTLTVTDVRVQRVQEISEEDARAEGVAPLPLQDASDPSAWWEAAPGFCQARSASGAFALLWHHLHGPAAWDANPWVVALTFTVERRNIDAARAKAGKEG